MYNPRLKKTVEEFVNFMDSLDVPKPPGRIEEPVPANMVCGIRVDAQESRPRTTPEG